MVAKQLRFGLAARQSMLRGATLVAEAVRVTFGPRGRTVLLTTADGIRVSRDGMTIAREVSLPDPFEDLGGRLMRHAASRTQDSVGDGTTLAIVLAHELVRDSLRLLAAGADALALRRGITQAAEVADQALLAQAIPVEGRDGYERIAGAACADPDVIRYLAEAMDTLGKDAAITIEEGRSHATELRMTKGTQFDRGYLSSAFLTDPRKDEARLEETWLLLTDRTVAEAEELLPALELVLGTPHKSLTIIATDVEGSALGLLVENCQRGRLKLLAVKAPEFAERRTAQLEDLALLTGGAMLAADKGRRLRDVTRHDLGFARLVVSTRDLTTITDTAGDQAVVRARMRQIQAGIEAETNGFERGKLTTRLNRLAGGVASLRVGAPTEPELKERAGRAENALLACRAAAEEGVVPGGGVALMNAAAALDGLELQGDEAFGAAVLRRALAAPLAQLAHNGGLDRTLVGANVRRSQVEAGCATVGLDVTSGAYVELLGAGIADPVKLVRAALSSAASVAAMALTTEALVTESRLGKWREELRRARRPKPWPGVSGEAFQSPPPLPPDGR